ncbi:MAG: hydroxymethylglutaryl-CoA reductase [Saprospiraceae bacterium]|nr:hydroxymethylglutaryl-CoA reductase [Candidatus Brachybacter algidus]
MSNKSVAGFSKLSKRGKLKWIVNNFFKDPEHVMKELSSYWFKDENDQKIIDGLSENTISNFVLPYSVAPNFVINDIEYAIPMVIEESSVVAAASNAAKYWSTRGGFKARVISTIKEGCIYFMWPGDFKQLTLHLSDLDAKIRLASADITANMETRGGGILKIEFIDMNDEEPGFKKLNIQFDTCNSMGANFINSVLENAAIVLKQWFEFHKLQAEGQDNFEIIMSILTNYTPQCLVEAYVECPIDQLTDISGLDPVSFADRFYKAVRIANVDVSRATTHNKGIFNGIDAVVIATGNDYRAIEACGHAYAAKSGQYRSLSNCTLDNGIFKFSITVPLALGTVGGLTTLHPMAKRSLELLGNPSAKELMMIVAATGLAQNFGAVRSLVTTGIQKGHMRMHLQNMLWQMKVTPEENLAVNDHFADKTISYAGVRDYLDEMRNRPTLIKD